MPADTAVQLGMIGLGRMGSDLVRRLMRDGPWPLGEAAPGWPRPEVATRCRRDIGSCLLLRRTQLETAWLRPLTSAG